MQIKLLESAKCFEEAVKRLNEVVDITVSHNGIEINAKQGNNGMSVSLVGNVATIEYEKKCEFFRGILTLLEKSDKGDFSLTQKASFDFNGQMIDNSRNAVLNMKTAKNMIMYSGMLGLDNILLYNEDTFEVDNQPYFGYMRMRYTQKDVRELTDFGNEYGVVIIPCVQTLAHLAQALRWKCYRDICDVGDILMVDEDKTYELIEDVISSWRKCVDTDIINIGMDEAHLLGRGQYMDKYGFQPTFDMMCRHLEKVIKICEKYGFKPMMWSDMFFRLVFGDYYSDAKIDQELMNKVPKGVTLVYWDYYSTDIDKYNKNFQNHLAFDNEIAFAGGAWKWSGMVPAIKHSHDVTKIGLQSAKDNGVSQVFTTTWGDNGAEGAIMTIIPTLVLFAEISYNNVDIDQNVSSKVMALTGYTLEEYFVLCEPNVTPTNNQVPYVNPSKCLLLQDILMGLFDKHTSEDYPEFYKNCSINLATLAKRESNVSYIFDTLAKMCDVISIKCRVGVDLKSAYDSNNKVELKNIANKVLPEILVRLDVYYKAFKKQWYIENRTGGFDVQDLHFGGLVARINSAIELINMYLNGEISEILELMQYRLTFDCSTPENPAKDLNVDCNFYNYIATTNINGWY